MANPNSATTNPRQDDGSIYVMTLAQYNAAGGASAFPNQILYISDSGGLQFCNGSSLTVLASSSLFTASSNGLTPLSGGGTTTFLRADGTWTTPPIQNMTLAQFNSAGAAAFANQIVNITDAGGIQYDNGTRILGASRQVIISSLPLIIPSSGTIGNNGALSGITALPTTYANCYMYFPSNAIAAGVAAGLYYVVMSSTTAGTIYNNLVTANKNYWGIVSIPSSPTAFSTTGPGAYTQGTGAGITLHSLLVQANSLGTQGEIRYSPVTITSNSANNKVINANLGGVLGVNWTDTTTATEPRVAIIRNRGLANSQIVLPGSSYAATATVCTYISVDTTADVQASISAYLTNASDYIVQASLMIDITPGFVL
jgi:hypothetical protein